VAKAPAEFPVVWMLLYYCFTTALLLLYYCFTRRPQSFQSYGWGLKMTALLLLYYRFTTALLQAPAEFPVVWMGSEDALFTLYTSGSTGTRS
jgi:tryptophan-rich sensory protein